VLRATTEIDCRDISAALAHHRETPVICEMGGGLHGCGMLLRVCYYSTPHAQPHLFWRASVRSVLRSNQKTQLRPWAALAGMSQLGCLGSNLGMGKWTVEMWASDARTPMIANTFMHCNHYIADS
jgi:hypothetical protein